MMKAKDVHDAAANGELPARGDLSDGLVARVGELFQKRVAVGFLAPHEVEFELTQRGFVHDFVVQSLAREDEDERVLFARGCREFLDDAETFSDGLRVG